MTPIEASILSNCRIESNRIEKSIRQHESNRIESNYFHPNRNALPHSAKLCVKIDINVFQFVKVIYKILLDHFFTDMVCIPCTAENFCFCYCIM